MLAKLATNADVVPHFTLANGLLKYKNKIWVGRNTTLQLKLIQQLHSSPIGGHLGAPATIKHIQALFAWPGLKKQVTVFVHSCPTCQQAKPESVRYLGLLQPLSTPSAWHTVSLDFVEGLPTSHGYNYIFVVVDPFTK